MSSEPDTLTPRMRTWTHRRTLSQEDSEFIKNRCLKEKEFLKKNLSTICMTRAKGFICIYTLDKLH